MDLWSFFAGYVQFQLVLKKFCQVKYQLVLFTFKKDFIYDDCIGFRLLIELV